MARKGDATAEDAIWELYVRRAGDPPRRFRLIADTILIGRAPDCDVSLVDDSVSRQHAKLEVRKGRFKVVDLGSRNGIYVNGVRLKPEAKLEVAEGEQIVISGYSLTLRQHQSSEQLATTRAPSPVRAPRKLRHSGAIELDPPENSDHGGGRPAQARALRSARRPTSVRRPSLAPTADPEDEPTDHKNGFRPLVSQPVQSMTLLFLDIVNSTGLTELLGDKAFRAKSRKVDEQLRGLIREHRGTPIDGKVLGDGILAVFGAAKHALACALRCEAIANESDLQLHVGLHAGDVIREAGNVYGGAVNLAARVASASEPGEVLVSETVRLISRTSTTVAFHDRGVHQLKGIADAQRLYAVTAATQR